jgi:hypothetical protein
LQPEEHKSMDDIIVSMGYSLVGKNDYNNIMCEQFAFGDQPKELMLCDKYDNGFHMKCVRPIVDTQQLLSHISCGTHCHIYRTTSVITDVVW